MSQEQASQIDKRLNKRLKDTPIAIVGMASLFAGSRYLNQFWDLICDKIDAITQVPADRWQVADYFDPDKKAADKSYCKRGGFIPEVDFNPMEFGLPPNILELTATSQLLSLVVAKEVCWKMQVSMKTRTMIATASASPWGLAVARRSAKASMPGCNTLC